MFCSKCGEKIRDDSLYCYKCGNKVETVVSQMIQTGESETKSEVRDPDYQNLNSQQIDGAVQQTNIKIAARWKDPEFLAFMLVLVSSILLVLSYFLPIMTMQSKYKDKKSYYILNSAGILDEEIGGYVKVRELISPSVFAITKIWYLCWDHERNTDTGETFLIYAIVYTMIGVFSLLTFLCAAKGKPIRILLFDILMFIPFNAGRSKVRPGNPYQWSWSHYLYPILFVVILVGAIWMKVEQVKKKVMAAYRAAKAK